MKVNLRPLCHNRLWTLLLFTAVVNDVLSHQLGERIVDIVSFLYPLR